MRKLSQYEQSALSTMREYGVGMICRGISSNRPSQAYIYAECDGCGKARWVQFVKGQPKNNLCKSCAKKYISMPFGINSRAWKGGKIQALGYISIKLLPDDPFIAMANKRRYVLEHRLIIAKHLSRCLFPTEIVHHKNNIIDDNRIENLELIENQGLHINQFQRDWHGRVMANA